MAQISSMKCNLCSVNHGSVFCYECKHALCSSCRQLHDKIPLTKKHKVIQLNKVDRLVFQSELACETHCELFSLSCTKCNCLICSSCVVSTHKGHSINAIDEVVGNARQSAKEFIAQTKTKITDLTNTANKMKIQESKIIETNANEAKLKINNIADFLHKIVDVVKNIRIAEVTDFVNVLRNQLDNNIKCVRNLSDEYQNVCSNFEHMLKEAHDVTFFWSYVTNKHFMDTLEDNMNFTNLDTFPVFDPQTFVKDLFSRIEEKYPRRMDDESIKTIQREEHSPKEVHNRQAWNVWSLKSAIVTPTEPAYDEEYLSWKITGETEKLNMDSSDENEKDMFILKSRHKRDGQRRRNRRPPLRSDDQKVFVANIPLEVTETELKTFFERFGIVLEVTIMLGRRENYNIGFVTFANTDTAQTVLSQEPIRYPGSHRLHIEKKKHRSMKQ